ncbi:hypothetical protein ACKI1O_53940, partial [Streptomyces scabiei]
GFGTGIPINEIAGRLGEDPRTVLKVYAHVLGEQQTIGGLRRPNELASGPHGTLATFPRKRTTTKVAAGLGSKPALNR